MKRKILSIIFAVTMIAQMLAVVMLPTNAATSGSCGDGLTWSFNSTTGTLTISGYGAMTDYKSWSKVPWYSNFSAIENVEISSGVTSIGAHAFQELKIKSVTIPSGVTSIGTSAFDGCNMLTSVTFAPNSRLTTIGEKAFYCCSNLPEISIPDGVTSLGKQAFSICTKLIETENGVSYVDRWVTNCDASVSSAVLRSDTVGIGNSAFQLATNLTSITIPENVKNIVSNAFSGCRRLVEVINHSSLVITIGEITNGYVAYYAKEVHTGESKVVDKDGYKFYTYGGTNYLVCYTGSDTDMVLPADYNGETYEINQYAFSYSGAYKSVTIPSGVTSIGYSAFLSGNNLESVTFAENSKLTSIGGWAFRSCQKLTDISIPEGVTSIGEDTFYECKKLASVSIPNSVTSIGYRAFYMCKSLADITFGANSQLESIGEKAFYTCESLKSLPLPSSVTTISDNAFEYCYGLEDVSFGHNSKLESLGESAFYSCTSLCSFTFGNSNQLTSIGGYAFYNCSALETIVYCGNEEEWSTVTKGTSWNKDAPITVQYHNYVDGICTGCGDGDIAIGDVNGDTLITNADVLMIYRYIYNAELYPLNSNVADVNKDGYVTNADVLMIYRYIYDPALYPLG